MKLTAFPYRRATVVYVLALSLIGAAVLAGYALVARLNERTAHDAALVNTAGRQRLLVERIAHLTSEMGMNLEPAERAKRSQTLRENLQRWRRGHVEVVRGDAASLLSPPSFEGGTVPYVALEAAYAAVDGAAQRALAGGQPCGSPGEVGRCDVFGAASDYVAEMDELIAAFERASETKANGIGVALKGIALGAVVLLAAEGLLVFRPLIGGLRASFGALQEAHLEIQRELDRRREAERTRDVLAGLLPICAGCKRIRDDDGAWTQVERYIEERSEAQFSHGLCQDCIRRLYPVHAEAILAKLAEPEEDASV